MKIVIDMRVHELALDELEAIPDVTVQLESIDPPEERARSSDAGTHSRLRMYCFCTFPPANHSIMDMSAAGFVQISFRRLHAVDSALI